MKNFISPHPLDIMATKRYKLVTYLSPNLCGLFRGLFEGRGGGGEKWGGPHPPHPRLKLVQIMLET